MIKILLVFSLIVNTAKATYCQEKVRGFLLLFQENETVKHNLFLPYSIDVNKSLSKNIKNVKADTLQRIVFFSDENYLQMKTKGKTLQNEANNTPIRIIPVETQYGEWVIESRGFGDRHYVPYQLKLLGNVISEGYKERKRLMLMDTKVLHLKENH